MLFQFANGTPYPYPFLHLDFSDHVGCQIIFISASGFPVSLFEVFRGNPLLTNSIQFRGC